jgi:hypothetical protein
MNLTTFTEQGSKKSYMIMLQMRPSNTKNILRVLFISEHDSYFLISIFGLADYIFVCENKTKVQIHHEVVNKLSYREYKFLGKNSKEIFFFFLIDIFFGEKTPTDLGINKLDESDLCIQSLLRNHFFIQYLNR